MFAQAAPGIRPLLKHYHGNVKLPAPLYDAYAAFAKAAASGDAGAINRSCLPQAVRFTYEPRLSDKKEYGQDLNIPYLKASFDRYIRNLRKEDDSSFLIRTGTSAIWFVQTSGSEWKVYRYMDKPME